MEDHHSFYGVYSSPSLDDLFIAGEQLPATGTDSAALSADFPPATDDQDRVSDYDFSEDYRALWASLTEAGPSRTSDDLHESYMPEPPNNEGSVDDRNAIGPAFDCSFCQVLRQIVHVHREHNDYMKLEIHGTLGLISHAIAERKIAAAMNNNTSSVDSQFEMLDFSSKSTEEVKQFLTSYCSQRSEEGYVMSIDPLLIFYEALSVGLTSPQSLCNDVVNQPERNIAGGESYHQNMNLPEQQQQQEPEREQERATQPETRKRKVVNPRISLSEQRRRTARMKLTDLCEVFDVALVEASKRMEVCGTVIKKICRRDGVSRWPFRKIESVKRQIADLQRNLNSSRARVRAEAQDKIDRLRLEATVACGGISIL